MEWYTNMVNWYEEFPFEMFEKAGRAYPDFITAHQALFLLALKYDLHLENLSIEGECSDRSAVIDGFRKLEGALNVMSTKELGIERNKVFESIFSNDRIQMHKRWKTSDSEVHIKYPHGYAVISDAGNKTVNIKVCSWNADFIKDVEVLCSGLLQKDEKRNAYILTTSDMGGYNLSSIGMVSSPLEKTNYGAGVIVDIDHIIEDLKSDRPCGKVSVLNGEPGCGKTYAVRGIMDAVVEGLFILVQSHMVTALGEPAFATLLLETKENNPDNRLIVVIEDADNCLMPREVDNVSAVSALLNLGDGILGAGLNIRVLATTNLKTGDLDEAVRRPGRLCRLVSVAKLKPDEAGVVYKRLTGNERAFAQPATLAEVYRLAIDSDYKADASSKGMGFKK